MSERIFLFGCALLLATAGCFGGGDEEYVDVEQEESPSGEEIARYLDETDRSDSLRFIPADRDPFAAERSAVITHAPKIVVKRPVERPSAPPPRLFGIVQGGEKASARIGSETYYAGDRVAGFVIVAIGEDHIILERDGARRTVDVGRTLPEPGEGGIGS